MEPRVCINYQDELGPQFDKCNSPLIYDVIVYNISHLRLLSFSAPLFYLQLQ